ncbi:hypothetical protein T261_01507 [Streptomyces lydicus]|nr:hypothetical protein T261_01507 [Streptomyces lydicus]
MIPHVILPYSRVWPISGLPGGRLPPGPFTHARKADADTVI